MPDFKNIWLTTDFSENSATAVPYAGELARRFAGTVTLIHVFDGTYLSEAIGDGVIGIEAAHWIDPIYERLKQLLKERAEKIAVQEKISVKPLILRGNTVSEIVKGIKTHKADCLVIASARPQARCGARDLGIDRRTPGPAQSVPRILRSPHARSEEGLNAPATCASSLYNACL